MFHRKRTRWYDSEGREVKASTPGASPRVIESAMWYAWVRGKQVSLSENEKAAKQILREKEREIDLERAGLSDPSSRFKKTPLADHLEDWAVSLAHHGSGEKHIRETVSNVRRILDAGEIVFPADLTRDRALKAMTAVRAGRIAPVELDPAKTEYRCVEVAAIIGVARSNITALVAQHELAATGRGPARRYPAATVAELVRLRSRPRSSMTVAMYLGSIKQFARWLVAEQRLPADPLSGMRLGSGKKSKIKRVHRARRAFLPDELSAILDAAKGSSRVVRGLAGADRWALYLCATFLGWRAQELASLSPESFHLGDSPPMAFLTAEAAKNAEADEQPLPVDVAQALAAYLATKPAGQVIWPGSWFKAAAKMLRVDLKVAGIKYVVEGKYGDFHSLRHSYVALLDRAGVSLKQMMQLARHSDPKLTAARYGRASKRDLAETVQRLPALLGEGGFRSHLATQAGDSNREQSSAIEGEERAQDAADLSTQPLHPAADESNREESSGNETDHPENDHGPGEPLYSRKQADSTPLLRNNLRLVHPVRSQFATQDEPASTFTTNDHDLADLLAGWDQLPAEIRAAVLTLLRAAQPGHRPRNSDGQATG